MAGKLLFKGMLAGLIASVAIGLPRSLGAATLRRSMASEAHGGGAAPAVAKA
ncbi:MULTISPECIES: hypothetical protein [unclassified Xanthobacter]|uniref:hypothetical protein n=1 Tax=unclassified Xanthobacter TaxID=2623496 RepID=UPI001EDE0C92|nr:MULTISPECIES: hypothetical protein [unclassified Xanthobacter]